MNKNISLLGVFTVFILILYLALIHSISGKSIDLDSGKNYVVFNNSEAFYVEDLIRLNPDIEVVTYYLSENESVGYVNFLGGIGENFVINPETKYEIIVNKNITLALPYDE